MIKIDKLTGRTIILGIAGIRSNDNNFPPSKKKRKKMSPTRGSWLSMKARCSKVKSMDTRNHGDRGITICDRWINSYANFLHDMGERPEGKTLERIDNNGNYEPTNCKWATPLEQNRNTRRTQHLVSKDE